MFSEELLFPHTDLDTQEQVFDFLHEVLFARGYVHSEYGEKIKEREKNYPTGIPLTQIGVAIPHAEAEYAKKDVFAVFTSKKGIPFQSMEDKSPMRAQIIIALVFNDKDKHIEHLQLVAGFLQDESLLAEFLDCTNSKELYSLIKKSGG